MKPKFAALFVVAISFTAVAGCSGGASGTKPRPTLFGGAEKPVQETALYARTQGVPVYIKSGSESRLLGHLDRNERVVKIGEAKGYVKIRARGGSFVGWVAESNLVRRAVSAPAKRKPDSGDQESVVPQSGDDTGTSEHEPKSIDAADSADAGVSAAPQPPAAEPAPMGPHKPSAGVGASVFDPY